MARHWKNNQVTMKVTQNATWFIYHCRVSFQKWLTNLIWIIFRKKCPNFLYTQQKIASKMAIDWIQTLVTQCWKLVLVSHSLPSHCKFFCPSNQKSSEQVFCQILTKTSLGQENFWILNFRILRVEIWLGSYSHHHIIYPSGHTAIE